MGVANTFLVGPLALYAFYIALGLTLNKLWPIHSVDDWFKLFIYATPLRLSAWAFLIYWGFRSRQGLAQLKGAPLSSFAFHLGMMVALWCVMLTQAYGPLWPAPEMALGLLALIPVALLEETLFRGALFRGLSGRFNTRGVALLTALLFTLFHTRPQALAAWPHIFLTGIVFAHLRARGFSLAQLALIHWSVDALFFITPKAGVQSHGPAQTAFLIGLALYATLTVPRSPAK
jgi:membrane protease YdiL (CAAX protease family)